MRKQISILVSALLLLGLAACQRESIPVQEESCEVSFNVGLDVTKSIGDGSLATRLYVSIFDPENKNAQVGETLALDSDTQTWTPSFTLIRGKNYVAAFWAQNPASGALYSLDGAVVTMNQFALENVEGQDFSDAFFAGQEFIAGEKIPAVQLSRPFAQVNVLVSATEHATLVAEGAKATQFDITFSDGKGFPTGLDLLTGEVIRTATSSKQGFGSADTPLRTLADGSNTYIATAYVLCGTSPTTVKLDFTFGTHAKSVGDVSIPRNRQTKIIGSIL